MVRPCLFTLARGEHLAGAVLGERVGRKARVAVSLGTGRKSRPVQAIEFDRREREHEGVREVDSVLCSAKKTDAAFGPGLAAVVIGNQAFDGIEDGSELLVVAIFQRLDLSGQVAVGVHQSAQLYEGAHDGDIDLDCAR